MKVRVRGFLLPFAAGSLAGSLAALECQSNLCALCYEVFFDLLPLRHPAPAVPQPHRVRMAHNLIVNYGLYRELEVFVRPLPRAELLFDVLAAILHLVPKLPLPHCVHSDRH